METCDLDNGILRQVISNKGPDFVASALNTSSACISACLGSPSEVEEPRTTADNSYLQMWLVLVVIFMLLRMRNSARVVRQYMAQPKKKSKNKRYD